MTGLAPDPAVPQRDALLDPEAVARLLGRDVRGHARTYAKYRVGESLRVVHRVEAGGRYQHVAARTFRAGESAAAYERALQFAVPAGPLPPVLHAPAHDTVLWTFPNDRRLSALPRLAGGAPSLTTLLGRPCRTRFVSYAAERSASAQCLDADGHVLAYVKLHASGSAAARERASLETVGAATGAHLRVPRVLAADADTVLLEPLAGRRLDTLAPAERADALRRLGRALATLHTRAPVPDTRFARLDPERLANAVGVIARARPDAGGAAARLLAALLERPDAAAGPAVCLHGDANLRNALLDGGRIALLDLEDASAGPAAADLGQLLASTDAGLADALLAGYAEVAPAPAPESLRWHTAASVLARVALPAVNRVRPALLGRLRSLLEAAA
jgi:aminoglycoside phosphotransferase